MSDDKTKRGPQDRSKINVHEKYELDYWSRKFRVTPDELRDAVKRVGTSLEAIERELLRTPQCLHGSAPRHVRREAATGGGNKL